MTKPTNQTMLRELASVRDEHRSGALDLEWVGTRASLFFVFGQPSHATYETVAGLALDGAAALSALVKELPNDVRVSAWRPLMVDADTLHCSGDELMALFADNPTRQPGPGGRRKYDPPARDQVAADAGAVPAAFRRDSGAPLPFGVVDFPLLPLGDLLWTDAASEITELESMLPRLPDSAIVLHGTNRRAVALVQGGQVRDAVWVDGRMGLLGSDAAGALMTTADGELSAHLIDDPRLFDVIPLLWRAQRPTGDMPACWIEAAALVADARAASRTFALLVDGERSGTALFHDGSMVAVYSTARRRRPAPTTSALRTLLATPDARVTLVTPSDGPFEDRRRRRELPAQLFVADGAPESRGREATAPAAADLEPFVADDPPQFAAEPDVEPVALAPWSSADVADEPVAAEPVAAETVVLETEAFEVVAAEAVAVDAGDEFEAAEPELADNPEAAPVAEAPAAAAPEPEREPEPEIAPVTQHESPYQPHYAERVDAPLFATAGLNEPSVADAPVATEPEPEPAPLVAAATAVEAPPASPGRDAPPASTRGGRTLIPAWLRGAGRHATVGAPVAEQVGAEEARLAAGEPRPAADTSLTDARDEFVPARLAIDVDLLRKELIDIAVVWLGDADAKPVASVIAAARPGVDDFVAAIASISAMEVPGHEHAVVRAMAREMHFRATEVLCGV